MLFYRKDRAKRDVSAHKVMYRLTAEVADQDETYPWFTKNGVKSQEVCLTIEGSPVNQCA
jgi:hypothetical protein